MPPWVPSLVCLVICAVVVARHLDRLAASRASTHGSTASGRSCRSPTSGSSPGAAGSRRPARAHGGARDPVGRPAHLQLRAQGRLPAGGEDYRWAVLRGRMAPWQFQLFNLFFIVDLPERADPAVHRLPAFTVYETGPSPLGAWDVVLAVAVPRVPRRARRSPTSSSGSSTAWKTAERAAGRTPEPRFLQTGLFRVSRHPNFFFEQAQWWVFYGFAVAATGIVAALDRRRRGAAHRCCSSARPSSPSRSRVSKYPDYDDYRARTSAIVPWFPRGHVAAGERTA